ncbi:uncharacterized protein J4E78_005315 [Alternaria triticimaculans]|uniref:uncharacterized protein n=1 Tax=Alternaria triticimaculans TaxID=297637 RepID=UPI0020C2A68A|nr:uncharacterized protein J4E78_005315 [Alternaria triticimaculans]KAI4660611.1 hypothetical protein J4E78_005315 [Alternaria triticimaculans]
MASINDPTIALGDNFTKLSGPENFIDWFQSFKDIAKIHGYAEYFKDNAQVVAKPIASAFLAPQQAADQGAEHSVPQDWEYHLAVYNTRLQEWKDYDVASRSALALLHAAIEPSVWMKVRNTNSPASALKAVIRHMNDETPNNVLADRARTVISSLDLRTSTAVRQFVVDFNELYGEVYFDADISTWAIEKINAALPRSYHTLVEDHKRLSGKITFTGHTFKGYRSHLFNHVEEDDPPEMNNKARKISRLR